MQEPAELPPEPGAQGGATPQPVRLFVGGLSYRTDEDDLRKLFSEYGEVTDARIIKDRDTGDSRGFGFVTLADNKDAQRSIKGLDGHEHDGRRLRVSVAAARRDR
ncbi:MAG: RNA-binding protein [Deltaproteobacteria bacterium]|nr:MAG: RNA-binding protein [Deltaproteobacteria bacterium]